MADSSLGRTKAFISCSYADRQYLECLQKHLKPLLRERDLQVWDDSQIQPGANWREEFEQALATACVAILLVSGSFLASDFIASEELSQLLAAAKEEGTRILLVILSPSAFSKTRLSQFQTVNDPVRPLNTLPEDEQEGIWARLAETAYEVLSVPLPIGTTLLTYTGHSAAVQDVAWSPDGRHLASGGWDKTVQVWDASTGQLLHTYTGHTYTVNAVAWSPDGRHLASGSGDETVQIWDASTSQLLHTYTGHTAVVTAVAWSPDGRRLASGSDDNTVQVWDASTGQHLHTYQGHQDTVFDVAWSPDGRRLASGSDDNTVQVWDAFTGQHLRTYTGHREQVLALAWSPDGRRLASGSGIYYAKDSVVQVWDVSTGQHLYTYTGHRERVQAVAWSPDGTRIASGAVDTTVQIWAAE